MNVNKEMTSPAAPGADPIVAMREAAATIAMCADSIVELNVELLRKRSAFGVAKYGVTMADSKLPLRAWLVHALEESLDHANCLQAAMQTIGDALPHCAPSQIPYGAVSELAAFQYWAAQQTEPLSPISAWQARADFAASQPAPVPAAVAPGDPLCDFKEGQWWVQELDRMAETAHADGVRAVAVVHNMLRAIAALPPVDAAPVDAKPFAYFARTKGLCGEWGDWFEVGQDAYNIRINVPRKDIEVVAAFPLRRVGAA